MKIGIHNEPRGGGIGGSEVSVAVLAEALARNHEVVILHHRPGMTRESLEQYAGVDLSNVRLTTPAACGEQRHTSNFWEHYRWEKSEQSKLSDTYDLFITFTHGLPPYCGAPVGVMMVLFPFEDLNESIKTARRPAAGRLLGRTLRSAWLKWRLHSRLSGYQVKAANSNYTCRWTKRRWNADCQVVFPPIQVESGSAEKTDSILSVGRFAVSGPGKNQREMIHAFSKLKTVGHRDWQYHCVGSCGGSEAEQTFLSQVKQQAGECGAKVEANLNRARLKSLYQQAKIFWHAAGMNVDESTHPELLEHFGMTTVEAMAAGCVPVVINRGGQAEIVEHGVSGFLWNSREEWQNFSIRLMQDRALWEKMSAAARARAALFSRDAYIARFQSLLEPYLKKS